MKKHSTISPISVRIPEAVAMTGISRSRLYELIRSGDIATAKVGASTLVLVESLQDFIEKHRKTGEQDAGLIALQNIE